MRIFVLEDDLNRRQTMGEQLLPEDEVTTIDTCTQAIKFQPPYDLVLLDHDLGGRQMEHHVDCGTVFVRMMLPELMRADVSRIVIHSYNPDGAARMARDLQHRAHVYVAPFGGAEFWRHLTAAREASIITGPEGESM